MAAEGEGTRVAGGNGRNADFEYDVCLSFAGEQRGYVEEVAQQLRERGVRVFFDDFERADLWGKDLYDRLAHIYSRAARYCVLFVSKEYGEKVWPSHERQSAQARALEDHGEYVLPARFDDTEVPGLRGTIKYEDLDGVAPDALADLIVEKLRPSQTENFLPPEPDRLYVALDVEDGGEQELVAHKTRLFFTALRRMSDDERQVVFALIGNSCPAELPDNLHISADLLRRVTGLPPAELKARLAGVRSLGFVCSTRSPSDGHEDELLPDDEMLVLQWHDLTPAPRCNRVSDLEIAVGMIQAAREPYCAAHADKALRNLNFTGLSSQGLHKLP